MKIGAATLRESCAGNFGKGLLARGGIMPAGHNSLPSTTDTVAAEF
jgi:hypothetical protein